MSNEEAKLSQKLSVERTSYLPVPLYAPELHAILIDSSDAKIELNLQENQKKKTETKHPPEPLRRRKARGGR